MPQIPKRAPPSTGYVCPQCNHNAIWSESRVGLCFWCDPNGKHKSIGVPRMQPVIDKLRAAKNN